MTDRHTPTFAIAFSLTLPLPLFAEEENPYAEGGNIPPEIVALSAEEEAKLLGEVEVAEGFDVTLFSSWQAANYPVYVAAAPNGDLYVSSDGNGSLGRKPNRGRVLRLRDTDHDGRADEVTEFVKNIDAPRGLVWDHDRLYLLHPPDISVYLDRDGDGVAEESKTSSKVSLSVSRIARRTTPPTDSNSGSTAGFTSRGATSVS